MNTYRRKFERDEQGIFFEIPQEIIEQCRLKGTENVTISVNGEKQFLVEIE
ncbi:MAG: hypothetical protein OXR66_06380 [Candidatus Woesearchaeota archaeon]|nr:hypothetical protein [Candidatus Woesearchaeota archaeon]